MRPLRFSSLFITTEVIAFHKNTIFGRNYEVTMNVAMSGKAYYQTIDQCPLSIRLENIRKSSEVFRGAEREH